jgi:hypothetical protein
LGIAAEKEYLPSRTISVTVWPGTTIRPVPSRDSTAPLALTMYDLALKSRRVELSNLGVTAQQVRDSQLVPPPDFSL